VLKRLGGMSRSAIEKTRSLLGNEPAASSALREVRVVGADDHPVTRKLIGRNALKVLDRLHESGHRACLVGGGVRDALVGLKPKDFDVATDASPEQVTRSAGTSLSMVCIGMSRMARSSITSAVWTMSRHAFSD